MQITARRFTLSSSCPRCRKEFFEVSNAAFQSRKQWCWNSAAVSSDSFSSQHGRKKVTKQERNALVLAFVEKYRAFNGGKFPTVSCTQKQVGGSYYVVREIIQELEHNHKRAPIETKKEIKIREENANCENFCLTKEPFLADAKQTSFKEYVNYATGDRMQRSSNKSKKGTKTSRLSIEAHADNQIEIDAHRQLTPSKVGKESQQAKGLDFDKFHSSHSPATVKPQTHTSGTSDTEVMNVGGHQVSAKLETKTSILHTSTEEIEACGKDAASAFNSHEEAFRSEELYHGQRQIVELGAPLTKRSNFWGNLKSMAVGIINLWKK